MKHTLRTLFALSALLSAISVPLPAAPHRLTKRDATELFSTLAALDGVGVDATLAAADDLLALRPHVETRDLHLKQLAKAAEAAKRAARKDPALLDSLEQKLLDYAAAVEAEDTTEIEVDLKEFALTRDEVASAKLRPGHVAILRRLEPKVKPASPQPR